MVDLFIESGHASINKHDETLCGDSYSIKKNGEQLVAVLSDGLGSGVKANILSTLTANMLSTMMLNRLPIDECIETVASTLPMCRERKLAYSTFTLACFTDSTVRLVQYDNPDAVLLRNGKNYAYDTGIHFIGEKKICESTISLMENDMLVLMTDGITNAGIGKLSPGGWKREEVIEFLERWYTPDISPQNLAARLVEAGNVLCMDSNDDDMTALVFKVRPRRAINVMIGPPADPKDDARVLKLFFAKEGSHICCGGSTAHMISRYLNKPIIPVEDSGTDKVPAIATIEGMDLVTEGIITLQQVADLAEQYVSDNRLSITINSGNGVFIEDYDAETDRYYGISAYYGYGLSGAGLDILSVGNRARIVGTVQYYEAGGYYQVSGLSYRQMKPDDPNNLQKLSEGNAAGYVSISADDFASAMVSIETEAGAAEYKLSDIAMNTTVEMDGLTVQSVYVAENGCATLSCTAGDAEVTVRLEPLKVNGEAFDPNTLSGKTIDVRAAVDMYDNAPQLHVFTAEGISIH